MELAVLPETLRQQTQHHKPGLGLGWIEAFSYKPA
jgi:hypothetical protein